MTELDIEAVLNGYLESFRTTNPIDIHYTNMRYNPEEGKPFMDVTFLPGKMVQKSIGTDSQNRSFGVYQIVLNTPVDAGKRLTKHWATLLQESFRRGQAIIGTGVKVRIEKFTLDRFNEDEPWFQQVISIYYRSDIDN